jgi:hypothetical protein
MRYAITIDGMTESELLAVTAAVTALGAMPRPQPGTTPAHNKTAQTVAELAHATGAQPQPPAPLGYPAGMIPPPPAPQYQPPAPMAPQAPAPQPPATTAGVDSKGIAHHPDFHAPSGRKTNDGRWALKKGLNREAWEAWEAQQLAAMGAPRTAAAPVPQQPAPAAPQPPAPVVNHPSVPTASTAHPSAAEINAKHAPHLPPQGQTEPAAPAPQAPAAPVPNGHDPFAAAPVPAAPQPPAPPAPVPPVVEEERKPVAYDIWHSTYTNLMTSGKMSADQYNEIAARYGGDENPYIFFSDEGKRTNSYYDMMAIANA